MFGILVTPLLNTFAAACSRPTFLGILRPWYQYLSLKTVTVTNPDGTKLVTCDIQGFGGSSTQTLGAHSPFLLIGLAILDDLIRIAALVAVGFVIAGGIQYVTSQGSPDTTKRAQQTIINALIGVAIAILAASIVSFIGSKLGS